MKQFESKAPVAEEMLDCVICSREQFNFEMRLESGDDSKTFRSWRQRVPDSWCCDAECFALEVNTCRRLLGTGQLTMNWTVCYCLFNLGQYASAIMLQAVSKHIRIIFISCVYGTYRCCKMPRVEENCWHCMLLQ